jgi:hypothetical protein
VKECCLHLVEFLDFCTASVACIIHCKYAPARALHNTDDFALFLQLGILSLSWLLLRSSSSEGRRTAEGTVPEAQSPLEVAPEWSSFVKSPPVPAPCPGYDTDEAVLPPLPRLKLEASWRSKTRPEEESITVVTQLSLDRYCEKTEQRCRIPRQRCLWPRKAGDFRRN